MGGTITGEHGVGHEKIDQMCVQFSPTELTQFFAVKNAFDPDALLIQERIFLLYIAVPSLVVCMYIMVNYHIQKYLVFKIHSL